MNNETITQLTTTLITVAGVIGAALISLIGVVVADIIHLRSINRHLGFGKDEASMKRQLEDKLGSSGKSVTEQLGIGSKSITEQLGVGNDKSISTQLGVGNDDKSLTAQHREMYETIVHQTDKISSIYGILHDNQVRQSAENTSQANLAATMAAFQQSYVAALNENSELKVENLSLKEEISSLQAQIADLQAQLENIEESDSEDDPDGVLC